MNATYRKEQEMHEKEETAFPVSIVIRVSYTFDMLRL